MSAHPEVPVPQPPRQEPVHWLYRPGSTRVLWIIGLVLLALTVAAELLVHLHPAFRFDDWFGFNASYGFLACVAMVLFARLLGLLVKRPEDYYDRRDPEGDDDVPRPAPTARRRRARHGRAGRR